VVLRPLLPPKDPARTCARCGHVCAHVQARGREYCPNCGVPVFCDRACATVYYPQGQGCASCALPGRGKGALERRKDG
jgi:hypothetical protein